MVVPLDAAELWAAGDLTARRSVLTALVDGVVVLPGKRGQFDPHRVRVVWRSRTR